MGEPSSNGEGPKGESASPSRKGRLRLTKEDRVRLPSEYRRIMHEGVRYRTSHFHIRMLTNSRGRPRLGIAAGRKVGNACTRNRIKRRLREYFRLNRDKMPPDKDMVFIPFGAAAGLDARRLAEELDGFFETQSRASL